MEFSLIFQDEEKKLQKDMNMLLSTRSGSVPVDREFGLDWGCLDTLPEVAESLLYQELLNKVERYVPDVQIEDVEFEHNPQNGEMRVVVGCKRRDSD